MELGNPGTVPSSIRLKSSENCNFSISTEDVLPSRGIIVKAKICLKTREHLFPGTMPEKV